MRVLETERLRLRHFALGDAPMLLQLVNDPDWLQHIGDRAIHTLDAARAFVEDRLVAAYVRHGFGLWATDRRDTGECIGMCGLVCRDELPEIDLGYALLPAHRGHGFAREAAAAVRDHAVAVLGRPRLLALVSPANARSIAVLRSLGMRRTHSVQLAGQSPSDVYEYTADADGT